MRYGFSTDGGDRMASDKSKTPAGARTRRHHNTKGLRQIRRGKTTDQIIAMAERLGIPYVTKAEIERKKDKP